MDDRFQEILDSLPEKPPRSRLEPYRELIDELRRRGRTYREIAHLLAEKCQLSVSISTVHDFVQARSQVKQKRSKRHVVDSAKPKKVSHTVVARITEARNLRPGTPVSDQVQARIAALKQQAPRTKDDAKRFDYDPSQPLRLTPKAGKKSSR